MSVTASMVNGDGGSRGSSRSNRRTSAGIVAAAAPVSSAGSGTACIRSIWARQEARQSATRTVDVHAAIDGACSGSNIRASSCNSRALHYSHCLDAWQAVPRFSSAMLCSIHTTVCLTLQDAWQALITSDEAGTGSRSALATSAKNANSIAEPSHPIPSFSIFEHRLHAATTASLGRPPSFAASILLTRQAGCPLP